jgi:hypothetical protein
MAANVGSSRLYAYFVRRWWLAWAVMGASFVLFGLLTLNLLQTFNANLNFLSEHGLDAVREGGLRQLIELVVTGYLAVACYVVFKFCEKVLVDRLASRSNKEGGS